MFNLALELSLADKKMITQLLTVPVYILCCIFVHFSSIYLLF